MKNPKEYVEELVETHYNTLYMDGGLNEKRSMYDKAIEHALITISFLIAEFQFHDTEYSDEKFNYFLKVKEELFKM